MLINVRNLHLHYDCHGDSMRTLVFKGRCNLTRNICEIFIHIFVFILLSSIIMRCIITSVYAN